MRSLKHSLFGKIFSLAAVVLSGIGLVAALVFFEASARDEHDTARLLETARVQVEAATQRFLADANPGGLQAVEDALADFEALSQPYRAGKTGAQLSASMEAYRAVFEQRMAQTPPGSAEPTLSERIQVVEDVLDAYHFKAFLIDVLQTRQHEKDYFIHRGEEQASLVRDAVALLTARTAQTSLEQGIKDKITAGLDAYLAAFEAAIMAFQEVEALDAELLRLTDEADQAVATIISQKAANAETMAWIRFLGSLLALGLGLLVAYFAARAIARPLEVLEDATAPLETGAIDLHLEAEAAGIAGSLARRFQQMLGRIEAMRADHEAEKARTEQQREALVQAAEAQQGYLAQRIDQMLDGMERFASGDLTVHLDAAQEDEMGRLFAGFNQAVAAIRDLLAQIHQNVVSTAEAVRQVGSSAEELAAGVQEQSAQAAEVAVAVEEMTGTINENAQNAEHTAETARSNGQAAEAGGSVVQQTVDKIREIAGLVSTSAQTVERLGASSEQIGAIISVIDEIADQTNLLALNAAIEAARAGEQGRGFAVVADEVRKLAERTTGATKEIAAMIKGIQTETAEAVEAMQQGTREVEEGIRLADEAGAALGEIVMGAQAAVDMINQIAAANKEQADASLQISHSVEGISVVSRESVAGIAEIAQAGDRLQQMTDSLRVLLGRFRMQTAEPANHARPAPERRPHLRQVAA